MFFIEYRSRPNGPDVPGLVYLQFIDLIDEL